MSASLDIIPWTVVGIDQGSRVKTRYFLLFVAHFNYRDDCRWYHQLHKLYIYLMGYVQKSNRLLVAHIGVIYYVQKNYIYVTILYSGV